VTGSLAAADFAKINRAIRSSPGPRPGAAAVGRGGRGGRKGGGKGGNTSGARASPVPSNVAASAPGVGAVEAALTAAAGSGGMDEGVANTATDGTGVMSTRLPPPHPHVPTGQTM
jgi:hypothetical protein